MSYGDQSVLPILNSVPTALAKEPPLTGVLVGDGLEVVDFLVAVVLAL